MTVLIHLMYVAVGFFLLMALLADDQHSAGMAVAFAAVFALLSIAGEIRSLARRDRKDAFR